MGISTYDAVCSYRPIIHTPYLYFLPKPLPWQAKIRVGYAYIGAGRVSFGIGAVENPIGSTAVPLSKMGLCNHCNTPVYVSARYHIIQGSH
jgi:hypothetical protein